MTLPATEPFKRQILIIKSRGLMVMASRSQQGPRRFPVRSRARLCFFVCLTYIESPSILSSYQMVLYSKEEKDFCISRTYIFFSLFYKPFFNLH
ncbi:hypothetical protein ACN38_g6079 [Penicillium nordicum]|uniref:Uncharacterized protein n=1 Tax=Penicillium nordicum TaxID=229535 RepID=A0A0M8P8N7_9EURO|nr:hypothetical protein ACN38_g6079 [Penicillium nordicum]